VNGRRTGSKEGDQNKIIRKPEILEVKQQRNGFTTIGEL